MYRPEERVVRRNRRALAETMATIGAFSLLGLLWYVFGLVALWLGVSLYLIVGALWLWTLNR